MGVEAAADAVAAHDALARWRTRLVVIKDHTDTQVVQQQRIFGGP